MKAPDKVANFACGYFFRPLRGLQQIHFKPERILDVGAAHGHFVHVAQTIWPDAKYTAVEANEDCRPLLQRYDAEIMIRCLAGQAGIRHYYKTKLDPVSGGNSLLRERSTAFDDSQVKIDQLNCTTLDTLLEGRQFDLIKLDTQGTEIEILSAGRAILDAAHVVILEASLIANNEGVPLMGDVIRFMADAGFLVFDFCGPREGGHFCLERRSQIDLIFVHQRHKGILGIV